MDLRKKIEIDYKKLNSCSFLKLKTKLPRNSIKTKSSNEEIQHLKGIVAKCLISSKEPTKIRKIEISNKFAKFLENLYFIGNRWTICHQILDDFNFVKDNQINKCDFCAIADNSFKLRLTLHRQAKYFNKELSKKLIQLKPMLFIQLTVNSKKTN